jgi:hypothetical protein
MSKSMTSTIMDIIIFINPEIMWPMKEEACHAFHTYYNLTGALSIR